MSASKEIMDAMMSGAAEIAKLRAQRDELLDELSSIAAFAAGEGDVCEIIARRARAAVAKIGGTP